MADFDRRYRRSRSRSPGRRDDRGYGGDYRGGRGDGRDGGGDGYRAGGASNYSGSGGGGGGGGGYGRGRDWQRDRERDWDRDRDRERERERERERDRRGRSRSRSRSPDARRDSNRDGDRDGYRGRDRDGRDRRDGRDGRGDDRDRRADASGKTAAAASARAGGGAGAERPGYGDEEEDGDLVADYDDDGAAVVDEEAEAARVLEESKARRAAILARHSHVSNSNSSGSAAATAAAAPSAPSSAPAAAAVAAPEPPLAAAAVVTSTDQLALPNLALLPQAVAGRQALSMFAEEDEFDEEQMAREGSGVRVSGRVGGGAGAGAGAGAAAASASSAAAAAAAAATDEADDPEGYYRISTGEVLGDRYQVLGVRGKGVFSAVLYCRDLRAHDAGALDVDDDATVAEAASGAISTAAAPLVRGSTGALVSKHAELATGSSTFVAVKIVRSQEVMRRAGQKEADLLKAIATADPTGRYHCVRLLHMFEHRGHICLVFEPLAANLKEVQLKFGHGVGLALAAVRTYAKQLLLSLALLAKLHIIHADIKPHNILANDRYNVIKLADFGSAFKEDDAENSPTPYLVSRFYRAPEIILGYKHTPAIDMWSTACVLWELYTGSLLFDGADNNGMLWRFQCLRGPFPHRMLKKHLQHSETVGVEPHFDADFRFKRHVLDPASKQPVVRVEDVTGPREDWGRLLASHKSQDDDKRAAAAFKDLLDKMLALDPAKRISVKDALSHPFIREKWA